MKTNRSIEDVDRHILQSLKDDSPSTPKDISENRLRENVVRLRCQQLTREDLVAEVTHDLYELSATGEEYVDSDENLQEFRESVPDPKIDRITDFSE